MSDISLALDETIAQLDDLSQTTEARKRADFEALRAIVGSLDQPWIAELEDSIVDLRPGAGRPASRGSQPDPREPDDIPPTRDGHSWGHAMRARFIAEAREKGGW